MRQAVEDDHAGKLESAVGLYAKALRYFEVYLRLERNKEQTDAVRPKVDQYRARLAKLREVLRAHHAKTRRSPPRDAADETTPKDESSDKPDETTHRAGAAERAAAKDRAQGDTAAGGFHVCARAAQVSRGGGAG